ncbi:MAG: RNA polymerase subunit sigma-70, partial [Sphingomonadales bacterium]
VPQRAIGDVNAHRAILEELDKVAAGDGVSEPTR